MKCGLCGNESASVRPLRVSAEAEMLFKKRFPGADLKEYAEELAGPCTRCAALPPGERRAMALRNLRELTGGLGGPRRR